MRNRKSFRDSPRKSQVLLIRNIPSKCNNIENVYQHFSKYGKIQGILCDEHFSQVLFQDVRAAEAAYESSEPFCDNRFIKISYSRGKMKSQVNLQSYVDKKAIGKIAATAAVDVDRENNIKKEKETEKKKKIDIEKEISKLTKIKESLSQEVVETMIQMETAEGEERVSLKKRIIDLSKTSAENDEKIKALLEMKGSDEKH